MTAKGSGVSHLRTAPPTLGGDERPELSTQGGVSTLARFAYPRAETKTTLAILSDPHVSTGKEGTWKVYHRTEARLRAAIEDANHRDVDGVVVAGDLTEDGRPEDFTVVADLLGESDSPVVAIPGNHDVPKSFDDHDTPSVSTFESEFTPGELPFRERLGGVDVLGLNSAAAPDGSLSATHDGAISDDQLTWLESALPETDAAFVVSHHNLPGLESRVSEAGGYAPHSPVGSAPEFVDALAGHDALHVSGHVHLPATVSEAATPRNASGERGDPRAGDVRGFVCPALSSFPQAYTLAEIGPEGTTLRLVPVADPEGVSEAYELAQNHSARSQDVSEMVVDQLRDLPLVEER